MVFVVQFIHLERCKFDFGGTIIQVILIALKWWIQELTLKWNFESNVESIDNQAMCADITLFTGPVTMSNCIIIDDHH